MNESSPVNIVPTDHIGFQLSGWKSVMERHSLVLTANRPFLRREGVHEQVR